MLLGESPSWSRVELVFSAVFVMTSGPITYRKHRRDDNLNDNTWGHKQKSRDLLAKILMLNRLVCKQVVMETHTWAECRVIKGDRMFTNFTDRQFFFGVFSPEKILCCFIVGATIDQGQKAVWFLLQWHFHYSLKSRAVRNRLNMTVDVSLSVHPC